jgi:hypothetical protein
MVFADGVCTYIVQHHGFIIQICYAKGYGWGVSREGRLTTGGYSCIARAIWYDVSVCRRMIHYKIATLACTAVRSAVWRGRQYASILPLQNPRQCYVLPDFFVPRTIVSC